MEKRRPATAKKTYRRPVLERYGDLRTLTRGGGKSKDEANTPGSTSKTRAVGAG